MLTALCVGMVRGYYTLDEPIILSYIFEWMYLALVLSQTLNKTRDYHYDIYIYPENPIRALAQRRQREHLR